MLFGHHIAPQQPTSGCAYVARIDFSYGERQFKAGEEFDWRRLEGCSEYKAYELFVSGHVIPKPDAPAPQAATKPTGRAARR